MTLTIVERRENDWVVAYIQTEDSEYPIAAVNANLRAQPVIFAAWERLLQRVIDDFAAFHGFSELISDTRTPISPQGDA